MANSKQPRVEVDYYTEKRETRVSIVVPYDPMGSLALTNDSLLLLKEGNPKLHRAFMEQILDEVFPVEEPEPEKASEDPPVCYNKPDRKETTYVQNGWEDVEVLGALGDMIVTRVPHMVTIPDVMSRECMQHKRMGEANIHGWDCTGCKHLPDALRVAREEKEG